MIDYTLYKIMNAHIHEWPYPYIVVDNVFHPDFYKEILAMWPDEEAFTAFRGYENRFEYVLHYAMRSKFWRGFQDHLGGAFIEAIMDKFGVRWAKPFRYVHLCYDRPGYYIEPHPDVQNKLITSLFYVPMAPEGHDNGTTIMNGKEDAFTVPYKANRLVAFKVSRDSWHRVKAGPDPRTSIQYFILKESGL